MPITEKEYIQLIPHSDRFISTALPFVIDSSIAKVVTVVATMDLKSMGEGLPFLSASTVALSSPTCPLSSSLIASAKRIQSGADTEQR